MPSSTKMDVVCTLWRGTKKQMKYHWWHVAKMFSAAAVVIVGGLGEEIAMIRQQLDGLAR